VHDGAVPAAPAAAPKRFATGCGWDASASADPAGQIALMHRELVDEKRWISERRFLHALNFCMMLPGPEAQQLATYIGWLMHARGAGSSRARCSSCLRSCC
jgi:chromate transporter